MIYNSLILSRLHYGNILWGNNPGSLIRLNKRALRAIVNAGINTHTNPIEKTEFIEHFRHTQHEDFVSIQKLNK